MRQQSSVMNNAILFGANVDRDCLGIQLEMEN